MILFLVSFGLGGGGIVLELELGLELERPKNDITLLLATKELQKFSIAHRNVKNLTLRHAVIF
jgi:hypothetical protein